MLRYKLPLCIYIYKLTIFWHFQNNRGWKGTQVNCYCCNCAIVSVKWVQWRKSNSGLCSNNRKCSPSFRFSNICSVVGYYSILIIQWWWLPAQYKCGWVFWMGLYHLWWCIGGCRNNNTRKMNSRTHPILYTQLATKPVKLAHVMLHISFFYSYPHFKLSLHLLCSGSQPWF